MIVVSLKGALGNQMFQYAAGRALAEIHKTELFLDTSYYENEIGIGAIKRNLVLDKLKIEIKLYNKPNKFQKLFRKLNYFKEPETGFSEEFFKLPDNTYLDGFWQNPKYFKDIESIIRQEFEVKTELIGDNKEYIEKLKSSESVAVHIRRSDYITHVNAKNFHGVLSIEYYENAILEITKRIEHPEFFIFSDDPAWVESNLKDYVHNAHFVTHNDIDHGFEDLRLMTKCKHFIIANSTFSWWGAYLSPNRGKIIVAPKKWYVSIDKNEIVPNGWIKI